MVFERIKWGVGIWLWSYWFWVVCYIKWFLFLWFSKWYLGDDIKSDSEVVEYFFFFCLFVCYVGEVGFVELRLVLFVVGCLFYGVGWVGGVEGKLYEVVGWVCYCEG